MTILKKVEEKMGFLFLLEVYFENRCNVVLDEGVCVLYENFIVKCLKE